MREKFRHPLEDGMSFRIQAARPFSSFARELTAFTKIERYDSNLERSFQILE